MAIVRSDVIAGNGKGFPHLPTSVMPTPQNRCHNNSASEYGGGTSKRPNRPALVSQNLIRCGLPLSVRFSENVLNGTPGLLGVIWVPSLQVVSAAKVIGA
jgi:hypothetical protein